VTALSPVDLGRWLLLILAVVAILAGFALIRRPGQSVADTQAAELCRGDYRRARSAADTATVDARRPIISEGQATTALTCGAMRHSGFLR
jgi:hypothetical protein